MNEPTSLLEVSRAVDGSLGPVRDVHYPSTGHQRVAEVEQEHFWFTARRKVIRSLLEKCLQEIPAGEVIGADIGCGTGYNAIWLTEMGIPVVGIDAHPGFKKYALAGRGHGFICGDIHSVEPKEEFDFILLLDVIEHIEDDLAFLLQAGKSLKPGGIAILTVPALRWLWSNTDENVGHYRRYHKRDIQRLAERSNGKFDLVESFYFYGSTLLFFLLARILTRLRPNQTPVERLPPAWLNGAFQAALDIERRLFLPGGMPLGSSLFAVLRKPKPDQSRFYLT